MANVDAKLGLRPMEGQNARARRFRVLAAEGTGLFINDPAKLTTNGGILPNGATSEAFLGNVIDLYDSTGVPVNYLASGLDGFATVNTNPFMRYQVQVTTSAALTASAIGDTADFIANAGDTSLGQSRYELSSTLKGAGNSGAMRIIGLVDRADNIWGSSCDVVVVPELHAFVSTPKAI